MASIQLERQLKRCPHSKHHRSRDDVVLGIKQDKALMAKRIKRYSGKENSDRLLTKHSWVFLNPNKQNQRADGYSKSFRAARKAARIPKLTSYTLRHYFASKCIMSGFNLFAIARWMGHSDLKMIYATYGHLLPDFSAQEMNKLTIGEQEA